MAQTLLERLPVLQKEPRNIRNICIMAHVDHGKTTLADSLIASNGIISHRMSGKLRYMDSRRDEQERGITMKSSSITLQYNQDGRNYLVNLIDSPGHVDFSGEVFSAIQVCDGALILVDVVEGVCAQTIVAVRHAWANGIQMVLVLNKIDRLITELKMTTVDAYIRLQRILEQVNAVVGELFNADVFGKSSNLDDNKEDGAASSSPVVNQIYDWSSGLDDTDDSHFYFTPDQGNVVFASGLDGWGFRVQQFAQLYSLKLGMKKEILEKTLWGDFYLNAKTKRIMKGAQSKAKKCVFVQFILDNIWSAYEAIIINRDKEKLSKIVKSLNLKVLPRDINHSDCKVQLQAVFHSWLPLSAILLEVVCEKLPSPLDISEDRANKLICYKGQRFDSLPKETQALKQVLCRGTSLPDDPVIVFVSKMFAVEKTSLPNRKHQPLTEEEIAKRRAIAKENHLAKQLATSTISDVKINSAVQNSTTKLDEDEYAFIAFARVFSGILRKGQRVYVLGPKHDPSEALAVKTQERIFDESLTVENLKSNEHITCVTLNDFYILMGRELELIDEVPAGNILGIGQLEFHVIKHATLSSTVACPSLGITGNHTVPIMRVAVESKHPGDMPSLVKGLKLLNQADAWVKVLIQETGEHVIVTAGEVHLQRCLDDLRERFAKVPVNVSPPIVPFRETIVLPPKVDMVNEKIVLTVEKNQAKTLIDARGIIEAKTSNRQITIKLRACPLPEEITTHLEANQELIKVYETYLSVSNRRTGQSKTLHVLDDHTISEMKKLKTTLEGLFKESGLEWENAVEQLWCFGPHRCGPNVLLCRVPKANYSRCSYWDPVENETAASSQLSEFDSCVVGGFQLATNSGPMCEEPMRGTCFLVEDYQIENQPEISSDSISDGSKVASDSADLNKKSASESEQHISYGQFSGQVISLMRDLCRKTFQFQPQRLMTAMYSCNIQVTAEVLGKMYAVLGKRHGRILHGDVQEGSAMFDVTAVLPVIESFDFANEIRRQTSGQAVPQLTFSHWEVIDIDPYWVPTTEEEYMLYGEKADSENRALKYVNGVRRRKGLPVDDKIVEHAEKQRTLAKKK